MLILLATLNLSVLGQFSNESGLNPFDPVGSPFGAREVEQFNVSKVGKDKTLLMRAFNAVTEIENEKRENLGVAIEILQRVGEGHYHFKFIYDRNHTRNMLVLLDDKRYADGQQLMMHLAKTEKVHEYTTVLGAKANIRVFEQTVPEKVEPFTRVEFLERLKGGEKWLLENFVAKNCSNCIGGTRSALRGGGRCQTCGGTGKTLKDLEVIW